MKRATKIIAMISLILLPACEEVMEVDDLPFDERLVIRGVLQAGDTVRTLYVGKTLPYRESIFSAYTPSDDASSWVKNATVSIVCDGRSYSLQYTSKGNYANDSLIIQTGKAYALTVLWQGKRVEAQTIVPSEPELDTAYVASRTQIDVARSQIAWFEYKVKGIVKAETQGAATSAGFSYVYMSSYDPKYDFIGSPFSYNVYDTRDFSGVMEFGATAASQDGQHFAITVQNFDQPYFRYFKTAGNELNSTTGGYAPVAWNVTGDGIGMFIGASRSVSRQFR
jgi:hypothetical protein